MSSSDQRPPVDGVNDRPANAGLTDVLGQLTDRRQRVLACLLDEPNLEERELAASLAGDGETATTRIELRQIHLPALAAAGLVEYDRAEATVSASDHPLYDDPTFRRFVRADRGFERLVDCLADDSRRRVLATLRDREGEVPLGDLACAADAGADQDGSRLALHHSHLPKLDANGLVDYDPEAGVVAPTLSAADAEWVDRLLEA